MNNRTVLILSVFLSVIVFLFHFSAKRQPSDDEARMFEFMNRPMQWKGRLAPDFSLDLLNGEKFTLSDHVGNKAIILNFFATWCGPCKEEMPELVRYYEAHKDESLIFIGVDSNESEDAVRDFISDYGVTYPVGVDRSGKAQRAFSVRAFPTTVFIGADGIVHLYEVGPVSNADVAFDALYKTAQEAIRAGAGITKEAFIHKQNEQRQSHSTPVSAESGSMPALPAGDADEPALTGRAMTIAQKMNCPCGCSHKLMDCTCKTAKDIKESLRKRDFSSMEDEDVIKAINQEFCMK